MGTPAVLNHHLSRPASEPGAPKRFAVLLTACCGVFAGFGSLFIYTFSVFLKPLAAAFGWSRAEISMGFMAAVLAVAVGSPFLGRLFDRHPARRIVIPCTSIYALGFASLAFLTPHLWHFVLVLALMGIVGNGTTQLGYARFVSAWFDQSRGRALAAVMAGSGAGSILFPPLAQHLISNYGWRWAYGVLGVMALAVGLPLAFAYLYEPANLERPSATRQETGPGVLRDVLSFRFLGILFALLLFSLATNGLNTHWAALLTDRGFSPATAAAVLSAAGFATLGSKLITGYLLDRYYGNYISAFLFLLSAFGFITIIYAQSQWTAFAAAALVGIGMGAESDAVPYLLTRYFGLQRFSELYGYTWSVYAIAGGTGPLIAGAVFDKTHSYRAALLVFCAMVVAAAGLFTSLPKYKRV
jgi:MFS family permease